VHFEHSLGEGLAKHSEGKQRQSAHWISILCVGASEIKMEQPCAPKMKPKKLQLSNALSMVKM